MAAKRTPIGSFQGALSSLTAPQLGSAVIKACLADLKACSKKRSDGCVPSEVVMGCVLQGGIGQAPARQAAIGAGLPSTTITWTVNKVCSSGMKAVMAAAQTIQLGQAECVMAGGMESMSQAGYILPSRSLRYGHQKLLDSVLQDGLWDQFLQCHMGEIAEHVAEKHKITRQEQDAYAAESYRRAARAHQVHKKGNSNFLATFQTFVSFSLFLAKMNRPAPSRTKLSRCRSKAKKTLWLSMSTKSLPRSTLTSYPS